MNYFVWTPRKTGVPRLFAAPEPFSHLPTPRRVKFTIDTENDRFENRQTVFDVGHQHISKGIVLLILFLRNPNDESAHRLQ